MNYSASIPLSGGKRDSISPYLPIRAYHKYLKG
jgi:hypothetical protein